MEDFIYILIGIAWIAYSVYNQGQKQKRKLQAKNAIETEEEIPEMEQNLRSFLDKKLNLDGIFDIEDKPNEYLDNPYSAIDVVEEKDESSYFKAETEGVTAFKAEPVANEVVDFEMDDSTEEEQSSNPLEGIFSETGDFELKKAIIFSEILNPPYINK
jgi:hypothetical protein